MAFFPIDTTRERKLEKEKKKVDLCQMRVVLAAEFFFFPASRCKLTRHRGVSEVQCFPTRFDTSHTKLLFFVFLSTRSDSL